MTRVLHQSVLHVVTVPMTLEFFAGQAAIMRRAGIELVFVSSPGPELEAFAHREQVRVVSVPMSRRITPLKDLASLWRLIRLLRDIQPTIVHGHTPKAGLLSMIAAGAVGRRIRIYHLHGLAYETATGWKRLLQMACEWIACRAATQVLSVSKSVAVKAALDGLCPKSKIVVPGAGSIGGVDAAGVFSPFANPMAREQTRERLGIQPGDFTVGFVGRLARDKGIDTLWQAWRYLRESHSCARLVVVGPYERSRSDQVISAEASDGLRADPRVSVLGAVPRHALPDLYAAMDVLCLPTYREGFPVTILEAAAMALPCVGTRVTGCVDAVVEGRTGILVDAGDPSGLLRALETYLKDPNLRLTHGKAARSRVLAEYSPDSVAHALSREYGRLQGDGVLRVCSRPSA